MKIINTISRQIKLPFKTHMVRKHKWPNFLVRVQTIVRVLDGEQDHYPASDDTVCHQTLW